LRILAEPSGTSQMAEVVFPSSMSIAEAKAYVFAQIGEAPLCSSLRGGRWNESADAITLELSAVAGPAIAVPLADGVREFVAIVDDGWVTNAVRFAKPAGWNRESAAAWIAQHCA